MKSDTPASAAGYATDPVPNGFGLYMLGSASWFAFQSINTVMFAWLVAVYLRVPPDQVGWAQFAILAPLVLLLPVGGVMGDRLGAPRLVAMAHLLMVLPVLALSALIYMDALNYSLLVCYGALIGVAMASITPARDGLISVVAGERLQRAVVLVTLIQFAIQMVGFAVAATSRWLGPLPVLLCQGFILLAGTLCFLLLARRLGGREAALRSRADGATEAAPPNILTEIHSGWTLAMAQPIMRAVMGLNAVIGLFFMSAFQVGVPLFVRELHEGSPDQLALVHGLHMVGVIGALLLLLKLGDLKFAGRFLLLAAALGALGVMGMGLSGSFYQFLMFNVLWGCGAGVFLSVGRTLMQMVAPANSRGRIMSLFHLSFFGFGALGALLAGTLVEVLGVRWALLISGLGVWISVFFLAAFSVLWHHDSTTAEGATVKAT